MYSASNVSTKSFTNFRASLKRSSALQASIAVLMLSPLPAYALPAGGTVAGGSFANFNGNPTGASATITQTSSRGVLNWNQFNIGAGEAVTFKQPTSNAITLNRVTNDVNPSQILGNLHANGNVIVSNPNGVVFGPASKVDVAGIIATTAGANTADFMAGGNVVLANAGSDTGTVTMLHGSQITTTADNGLVALVAPTVDSEGQITASKGNVVLAGASKATFDLYGDGLLSFAGASGAVNGHVYHNGDIEAQSGVVTLTAVEAKSVLNGVVSPAGDEATALAADGTLLGSPSSASSVTVAGRVGADGHSGTNGGTVTINAQNVVLKGTGYVPFGTDDSGNTGASISASGGDTGLGGNVTVKGDLNSGLANLEKGANLVADGLNGGNVILQGGDVKVSGHISASPRTGTGNNGQIFVKSSGDVIINSGDGDDVQGDVSEQSIANASSNGSNFTLVASNITMRDLADGTLAGGSGNIEFHTSGNAGTIGFDNFDNAIHTTTGNITMTSGGDINIGTLQTGLDDFNSLTLDQPAGAIKAGSISLTSASDIVTHDMIIQGTDNVSSVTVNAGGNYDGRSIYVKILDLPQPGGEGNALVNITAGGNIDQHASIAAISTDQEGSTQAARTGISLISTHGDVTVGGTTLALSTAGLPQDGGKDDFSDATILISGKTVNLRDSVTAQAIGSNNPNALLTINADHLITAGDLRGEAATVPGSTGSATGNVTVTAPTIDATVDAADIYYLATNNLVVNGAISVNTPVQAGLDINGDQIISANNFHLNGGHSVTVTGDIVSPLVNVDALAGSGGISLADVTTGDRALLDSETQWDTPEAPGTGSQFGSFNPGNIYLATLNGGNITAGKLSTSGTYGNVSIDAHSAGTLTLGSVSNYMYDKPDHGSVGNVNIDLSATGDLTVSGDVTNFGHDTQGEGQGGVLVTNLQSGGTLTIGGDLTADAIGGIRGEPGDTGSTNSSVTLTATNAINVNGVEATANGGTDATAFVFLNAPDRHAQPGQRLGDRADFGPGTG